MFLFACIFNELFFQSYNENNSITRRIFSLEWKGVEEVIVAVER